MKTPTLADAIALKSPRSRARAAYRAVAASSPDAAPGAALITLASSRAIAADGLDFRAAIVCDDAGTQMALRICWPEGAVVERSDAADDAPARSARQPWDEAVEWLERLLGRDVSFMDGGADLFHGAPAAESYMLDLWCDA